MIALLDNTVMSNFALIERPDLLRTAFGGEVATPQQASSEINQASQIKPKGARLTAQIEKLSRLVDTAQTPIKITIASDNFTEVAVYKIARLGRFSIKELNLKPGTYTVVGARDGYQDVRQQIVIKPGQKPVHISIICKVKL